MADLTPAEELRAAAARLREKAKVATAGPWKSYSGRVDSSRGTVAVAFDGYYDSEWIATMHPDVAEPLAVLLEEAAEFVAQLAEHYPRLPVQPHARTLAIARVINGTSS